MFGQVQAIVGAESGTRKQFLLRTPWETESLVRDFPCRETRNPSLAFRPLEEGFKRPVSVAGLANTLRRQAQFGSQVAHFGQGQGGP
jgi:hypothetical protein